MKKIYLFILTIFLSFLCLTRYTNNNRIEGTWILTECKYGSYDIMDTVSDYNLTLKLYSGLLVIEGDFEDEVMQGFYEANGSSITFVYYNTSKKLTRHDVEYKNEKLILVENSASLTFEKISDSIK